jgi:hypothetical protein
VTIHDDITGFGALDNNGHSGLQEYTLSDNGLLSPLNAATSHGGASGGSTAGHAPPPLPTPILSKYGPLTIELVWDASVAGAPTGFTDTVKYAAQSLVDALGATTTNADTVWIDIGWGEIGGQGMSPSALGESMTNGYLVNDSDLTPLLTSHLTYLNSLDLTGATHDTLGGSNAPSGTTQFFLPTGEARALGYSGALQGSATSPDGYIGISTLGKGWSWQYTDINGNTLTPATSNWYSLVGDVWHELSEAMGRISMEGLQTMHGHKTFAPLDLFDYSLTTAGALSLSNTGGYFSINGGAKQSGFFNNAKATPGDIADWSSHDSPSQSGTTMPPPPPPGQPTVNWEDAFNAFGFPEYFDTLSPEDLLLMQALGY